MMDWVTMRITHLGHACVLLDTGSARLLIDPGTFSSFESVDGLDAVLITHHHYDHFDRDRLPALADANPDARIIADPGTVDAVRELGLQADAANPGDVLALGGAKVEVLGGEHGIIHPDLPRLSNIGLVVDEGAFYHPGDSLVLPERQIDVLALPTAAPWLKTSEAVEFLRAVAPRVAVPIHEALLVDPRLLFGMFDTLAPAGTQVRVLDRGLPTRL